MKEREEVVSMKKFYNEMLGFGEVVRETETHFYVRFNADPWVVYTFSKDAKNFKIIS
jgi:hypothetical protein